jgi:hypothetical protein
VAKERDAAAARVQALLSAQGTVAGEAAAARAEGARRDAAHAELRAHATAATRLARQLKTERDEARALADALQLQVESLQERVRAERALRAMHEAAPAPAAPTAGADAAAAQRARERALEAQNATLKATAGRLSRALAALLRQRRGGSAGGGAGWAAGEEPGCLADVLQQLAAVEAYLTMG